jgi:hypothetical protein
VHALGADVPVVHGVCLIKKWRRVALGRKTRRQLSGETTLDNVAAVQRAIA